MVPPLSYYAATATPIDDFPPLRGDARTDLCIVGGGYTGLMAALEARERGLSVVLLEAERVGFGGSGRNGGQLGSGQRRDQRYLEQRYGKIMARQLWDMAEEAKALARTRIVRHAIACDLKPGILTVAHRAAYVRTLHEEAEHLAHHYAYSQIHIVPKAELTERLATNVYHGGVLDWGAGHLHPLNYARGLARAATESGAIIHEKTRVHSVDFDTGLVATDQGTVRARFIIVACNAYLGRLVPGIAPYIMPINSFIIATEPLGTRARTLIRDDVAVTDTRFVVQYYRLSPDGRLLFGGRETYGEAFPRDIAKAVRPKMIAVFPQLGDARIDYAWGGAVAITPTRLPHLGRLGKCGYFAQGFSGHGVALSGLTGKLMAEAITGTAARFDVFAALKIPAFPGGLFLRAPLRALAMFYGKMRDAL